MYEESNGAGLDIRPDVDTWTWLRHRADQRYRGDLGRCIEEVLRAARIADQQRHHQGVAPVDLPSDPWQPLEHELQHRRGSTTT